MENFLCVKKFHQHVANNAIDDEWYLLHRQVCGYIRQWVYIR